MIKRNIESIIEDTIKHYPITLLTGPRQIGKTTLLYNTFISKGYSYVSLDDSLELSIAKSDPKTFLELHKYPLIINEIQKAPELLSELERIVNLSRLKKGNKQSNGMYILCILQRQILFENSNVSLSGRVAILDMSNLSLSELYGRENRPFSVDIDSIALRSKDFTINETEVFKYIFKGFFPALYNNLEIKPQLFYSSYLTTYLQKDLRQLIILNDEIKFINFLKILASNTGKELIYNSYAKQIGSSTNTIKSWINLLVKTGIIYLVQPYNEYSTIKRVVRRPKMYFFDTGFASYLCGIDKPETLQKSFLNERFFETFVFNELRKTYINSNDKQLFYYKDHEEIDFVLIRNGILSCIEIKSGQSFNASNTKAFKKLSNTKYELGKNAIICTADKMSIIGDKTVLIPISAI